MKEQYPRDISQELRLTLLINASVTYERVREHFSTADVGQSGEHTPEGGNEEALEYNEDHKETRSMMGWVSVVNVSIRTGNGSEPH